MQIRTALLLLLAIPYYTKLQSVRTSVISSKLEQLGSSAEYFLKSNNKFTCLVVQIF